VPSSTKTAEVKEVEWYLRTLVRGADASLAEEWERMRDPAYVPLATRGGALTRAPQAIVPYDLTTDVPAFTAAIRVRVFSALKAWAKGDGEAMLASLDTPPAPAEGAEAAEAATAAEARAAFEVFAAEHGGLRVDPEARNLRHTHVTREPGDPRWLVQQVLVDANDLNDWMAEFEVDVEASRARQQPVLWLRRVGPVA
jgi:Domain of unknown function (DUF3516)